MKFIKPRIEVIEQKPGLIGMFKQIEMAGRTCYKSEANITDDSAEKFVNRMIASNHTAMLEHGTLYLDVTIGGIAEDREYILYNIIQHGFLDYPKKNNTKCLFVTFIDNIGEPVLNLDEIDCKELAYVYLNWKNKGNGYGRCDCCNRFMKKSKKNPKRFCECCSKLVGEVLNDKRVILCMDCGKPVYVSIFDGTTIRCEECQSKADNQSNKERQKRWYDNHKNLTVTHKTCTQQNN